LVSAEMTLEKQLVQSNPRVKIRKSILNFLFFLQKKRKVQNKGRLSRGFENPGTASILPVPGFTGFLPTRGGKKACDFRELCTFPGIF